MGVSHTAVDDIFAAWKKERFIVADQTVHGYDNIIIILCDVTFWIDHFDQLIDWCQTHGATNSGMTVELTSSEQLMAFLLRWS